MTRSINGFYGSGRTPCNVLVYDLGNGSSWYCVEDSCNVNLTETESLVEGVDVQELCDWDTFTTCEPVQDEDELETAVEA
jgi:hypothetical protein